MAKQYYELYAEIKKLKPRTVKYFKAVSKMFHIEIDRKGLQKIREQRKNEAYKTGKKFSDVVQEYNEGIKYENMVMQRTYDIWSGKYFEDKTNQYVNNYIKALKRNNIDSDIVDYLENNAEIIKSGAVPFITDFYIPSRGKGKKYSLNIDNSETMNNELREFLEDAWNMPRKKK